MDYQPTKEQIEILRYLYKQKTALYTFDKNQLKKLLYTKPFEDLITNGYIVENPKYTYELTQPATAFIEHLIDKEIDKKRTRTFTILSLISSIATALFALAQVLVALLT